MVVAAQCVGCIQCEGPGGNRSADVRALCLLVAGVNCEEKVKGEGRIGWWSGAMERRVLCVLLAGTSVGAMVSTHCAAAGRLRSDKLTDPLHLAP